MIRDICKDAVFLARKSEPAGPEASEEDFVREEGAQ